MLFMGTAIARGRGRAVVTSTGMATEMGAIAGMIAAAHLKQTPLQAVATAGEISGGCLPVDRRGGISGWHCQGVPLTGCS